MTDIWPVPAHVVGVVPEGRTAYGIQLPVQSQSRLYTAEWERRSGPAEIAAVARAAEDAGFFYLGVCDHTAIPRRLADTMGTVWYDNTATLGWLAGITSRIRLLSHVLILAHRHPLRAAKELCTLDLLSGGRLVVGVGAGHVPEEYEAIAGDFHRRGKETDEALSGLAAALVEEFPTLPGPRWPAEGLGVAPRPVQRPRPPIWIGGSSPAALRRTALYGDGWVPQGTPRPDMPAQIAELRRLRQELRGGAPLDIGMVVEPMYLVGPGTGGDEGWEQAPSVLRGTPEQLAASLLEVKAMGVNQLLVRFMARSVQECCDQVSAFGTLVGPLIDGWRALAARTAGGPWRRGKRMTTFGLVHGAYHGGWCWDRLVPQLQARGFDTVAPDLPCDDVEAGLDRYASVVVGALEGHDDVVLVGHSLGSLTIPLVAARRPIRRMVFLCSVPTGPGATVGEAMGTMVRPEFMAAPRFTDGTDRDLLSATDARALFFHDCTEADAWWAVAHLRPQAHRPIMDRSPLTEWPDAATSVILTEDDRAVEPRWAIPAAREFVGEEPTVLPGSHSPFLSRPAQLADVLAGLAAR